MEETDIRPTAYSYVRMSTQQQLKGDSLRRQLERSREYAAENNLRLDDTLHDIGVSAYTGANVRSGALGQFLQLVQSGQIKRGSYLLVESLDRLSRLQVRNALGPFIELINAGITIVTLADKQVYSDATVDENWTQLMMSLAIMSRAHEESQTKSDRLQRAAEGRRKRALAVIGTYQPVHRVNGKSQPYGEALRGYLPATINEELFWRVQKNKRVRNSAGRKGERLTNLIGPLATCAHCQGRMLIKTGGAANNPQKYIRCDNNYRGGTCTGPTGQFRYDKVESAILDHVKEFHSFSAFARENNTTGKQQLQEKIASHETTLAELERQRKNLIAVAALADRDEVRAELMRELSDRRSREDSTKAELEIFRADLMTLDSAERNANSLAERIASERTIWETGSDEKVYESRSKIAQALKQIIDFISFDMNTRCFRVIIGFGIVAYEFDKQGRMTNKFDLATSHSSIGVSPLKMEHFAQGDESRHEKLSKVMREKQKAGEAVRLDTSGQPIKMLYDYEQKSHRTNALYDAVFKKTVHLLAPERLIHRDWPIKATYEQYDNIVLPDEWVKLQDNPIEPILEDFTALMKAAIAAHSVVLVRRNADESTLIDVEIVPMKDLALTP